MKLFFRIHTSKTHKAAIKEIPSEIQMMQVILIQLITATVRAHRREVKTSQSSSFHRSPIRFSLFPSPNYILIFAETAFC